MRLKYMPTSSPGQTAERGGDGEHGPVHRVGVHAHLTGRVPVLRGGPHGPSKLGEAQEGPQHAAAQLADAGDQQVQRPDRSCPHLQPPARQGGGQRPRVRGEQDLQGLVQHQPDADGRQQRRDPRGAGQRAQANALDGDAQKRRHGQDDQHRQRQRRVQVGGAGPAGVGAHSVNRSVREVDELRHPEDQRQPHRDQRVDVADDEAVDGVVEKRPHAAATPWWPAPRPRRRTWPPSPSAACRWRPARGGWPGRT